MPGSDEDQQGGLRVSPDEVAQELIESVGDGLGALPDLALADEDVAVVDADEDVGLAGSIEDFPTYVAFELGVQPDKQDVADLFLVQLRNSGGVAFECVAAADQHAYRFLNEPDSGGLLLRSQFPRLLGALVALGSGCDQLPLGGVLLEDDVAFSLPPLTLLSTFSRQCGHLIPDRHRLITTPAITSSRSG
jgi:hypothetical protein